MVCHLCRVGDTYPTQHLDVTIRAYVYRWRPGRLPSECGVPNVRSLLTSTFQSCTKCCSTGWASHPQQQAPLRAG